MAIHKLTQKKYEAALKTDGLHGDGGGLYLQVRSSGNAKSWVFRYAGRWMGLGPVDTIDIEEAREKARECRKLLLEKQDPMKVREDKRLAEMLTRAKDVTFRQCAEEWMKKKAITWVPSTMEGTKRRFEKFIYPALGNLPISTLDMRAGNAVDLDGSLALEGGRCRDLGQYCDPALRHQRLWRRKASRRTGLSTLPSSGPNRYRSADKRQ